MSILKSIFRFGNTGANASMSANINTTSGTPDLISVTRPHLASRRQERRMRRDQRAA